MIEFAKVSKNTPDSKNLLKNKQQRGRTWTCVERGPGRALTVLSRGVVWSDSSVKGVKGSRFCVPTPNSRGH